MQTELQVHFVKQDTDKEANVITIDTRLNTQQTGSIHFVHQLKHILTKCFSEIQTIGRKIIFDENQVGFSIVG